MKITIKEYCAEQGYYYKLGEIHKGEIKINYSKTNTLWEGNLDEPLLKPGDHLYINELDKVVMIGNNITRTTSGGYIYITYGEFVNIVDEIPRELYDKVEKFNKNYPFYEKNKYITDYKLELKTNNRIEGDITVDLARQFEGYGLYIDRFKDITDDVSHKLDDIYYKLFNEHSHRFHHKEELDELLTYGTIYTNRGTDKAKFEELLKHLNVKFKILKRMYGNSTVGYELKKPWFKNLFGGNKDEILQK